MVSRSRQSDSIIAVISQAALRTQRRTDESWFFMRVDDKTKFSYNCGTLKLKTAEFIGNWFPVILTQLTKFHQEVLYIASHFQQGSPGFIFVMKFFWMHKSWRTQILSNTERTNYLLQKSRCQTRAQKEQHLHFSLVMVQEAQKGFCGCKTGLL